MDDTNSTVIANTPSSFPSFIALRARHSELLQREPDSLDTKTQCLLDVEHFIQQVELTGAILSDDEERRASQNILNYWVSVLYREDGRARLITLGNYNPKLSAQIDSAVCPYPGVRPFTEEASQFFFGRQRQIDYMVGRLKEDRLLVIVGASGSGKTSLVQAGLLPALKREQSNNAKHFFFPPIVPGSEPLRSLALMIKRAKNPSTDDPQWLKEQVDGFRHDKTHLLKLIEKTTDDPAVIFIDQGEELYERSVNMLLRPFENLLDFDNSKETIEPLLDNLISVVQSTGRNHIVIIARRSGDYEPYTKRLPSRVKEVFEPARVVLPALYASELGDAIEMPAELLGVKFEQTALLGPDVPGSDLETKSTETTVQALVKEISSEPVGLPLLQFTLAHLWEKRDGNKIPDRAFREMVSCRTALSATAEEFYASLSYFDQRTCRRLLTQLVKLDRELKPHVYPERRTALYRSTEKQARVDSLIKGLTEKQLARISKGLIPADDWIELTHASLLSNWPRMNSWIEGKRRLRRQLQAAKVVGLAALIAVVALVALFFVGWQQQKAKSLDLARLSNKQANHDRFDLALLLGQEAYDLEDNTTTRGNLLRLLHSLQSTSHPKMFLYQENFEADDIAFSAASGTNSGSVAAVDSEGNIVIWNLTSRAVEKTLDSKKMATYPLAFSPDGKILATASLDPDAPLILWYMESGERKNPTEPTKSPTTSSTINSLAFSPDNKTLITGGVSGSVIQWDLTGKEITGKTLYQHTNVVNAIAFSADGQLMASGGEDKRVILSDARVKGARRRIFAARGEVKGSQKDPEYKRIVSLAFKKEGNQLAAGSNSEVFIWDIDSGTQVTEFSSGPNQAGILVSFRDYGEVLTAFCFDGTLILWDLNARQMIGQQFYKPAATHSATFDDNGQLLALPSDGGVVVWDVVGKGGLQPGSAVSVGSTVKSIAFSPSLDNQIMASLGGDGSLTVWEPSTEQNEAIGSQITEQDTISSFTFSGDGKLLAVALVDGTISLRDVKDHKQIKALDVQKGKLVEEADNEPAQQPEAPAPPVADNPTPVSILEVAFDPKPGSPWLAAVVVDKSVKTETSEADSRNDQPTKIILWNTSESGSTEITIGSDIIASGLAFSPDGETLAWSNTDSRSKKFSVVLRKDQNLETLPCGDRVSSLAFGKNGQTLILAAGLDNGKILMWDLSTRKQMGSPMEGSAGRVTNLAFGLDGTILAAVTNKNLRHPPPGEITLWDVKTREPVGSPLRGHKGIVSAISFSASSTMLASGSNSPGDLNIILWDLDIKHAKKRFCDIVDFKLKRSEVADQLKDTSWSQWFYRWVSGRFDKSAQAK